MVCQQRQPFSDAGNAHVEEQVLPHAEIGGRTGLPCTRSCTEGTLFGGRRGVQRNKHLSLSGVRSACRVLRTCHAQHRRLGTSRTQRAQYPLIKEYSLNHDMKPLMIYGIFLN